MKNGCRGVLWLALVAALAGCVSTQAIPPGPGSVGEGTEQPAQQREGEDGSTQAVQRPQEQMRRYTEDRQSSYKRCADVRDQCSSLCGNDSGCHKACDKLGEDCLKGSPP